MFVGKSMWNKEILKNHVTIGRTVKLYNHYGKQYGDTSKINHIMTARSSTSISKRRSKESKALFWEISVRQF